ncbi:MAG: hypothetical protein ACOC9W_06185, partial [Persicimonas sp.]
MNVAGIRGFLWVRRPGRAYGAPGVGLPTGTVWIPHETTSWADRVKDEPPERSPGHKTKPHRPNAHLVEPSRLELRRSVRNI